ncbi:antiviral reverse transcriptase Drt3a [Vibrio splendidus]
MFDQSFSVKNFRKIYDIDRQNKGRIEADYFPEAYKARLKINQLKKLVKILVNKKKVGQITAERFQVRKDKFNELIIKRNEQYNELINENLKNIVSTVGKKGYSLPLTKLSNQVRNKDVFSIGNNVEAIFVSKHIQYTLGSLFNVSINHRDLIVSRLSTLAKDTSPKYIVRADIESFYESICHKKLLNILHSSPKLSVTPRRVITQLIREFSRVIGKDVGLPRGVGLSSYLSEVYMNDVDDKIRRLQDITYYERYVDDLIVIFSPTKTENTTEYIKKIDAIVKYKGLKLNSKTSEIDLYKQDNGSFDYLGYKFKLSSGSCEIRLSNNKCKKIRDRVIKSFDEYNNTLHKTPGKAYKNLIIRLRFLTGNTRLYNSKSKAFVGVYFSNKFINSTSDLKGLDHFLYSQANNLQDHKLKKRINKLSFENGFDQKIFRKFSIEELSNMSKVWKNV